MYPEEAIAVSKTGKKEARILKSAGRFIIYSYKSLDGKEQAKYSLLLEHENGKVEHILLIPTKGGKELVLKHEFEEKGRFIFDEKMKKVIYFP